MNPWNPTPPQTGLGRTDVGTSPQAHATATRPTFGFGGASTTHDHRVAETTVPERTLPVLPPAEPVVTDDSLTVTRHEPVFRTEISFRRVQPAAMTPQASAGNESEPVVAPEIVIEPVTVEPVSVETVALEPVTVEPTVDEPSFEIVDPVDAPSSDAADKKVPFYKRELSFGRKAKTEPVVADVAPVVLVADALSIDESEEPVEEIEEIVAVEEIDEVVAVEDDPQPVDEVADESDDVELVDEPVADTTDDLDEIDVDVDETPAVVTPDEVVAEELSAVEVVAPVGETGRRSLRSRPGGPTPQRKSAGRGRGKQRRVVGLKIGASQIAAAVVAEENGAHELLELARSPLEPGIVVDGEVRDVEALTLALKTFFSEHRLPTRDVRIGLASSRIGVRTFDIVGIEDESRLDNAVRFKAHEVLPVAVHESVLDYRVLGQTVVESGEPSHHVLLVVAPRDQVEPYVEVCSKAGLKLAGIDLEALGVMRAFVEPGSLGREATDTATVVVAVGHEHSSLIVAGGSSCEFTRVFDWGGSTLQDAIAQELQVSPPEAESILRQVSLSGGATALDADTHARALDAVRLRLTPFARELVSSLQFYQSQPDSLGIGEILVTGGTSKLDGLAESLHQMIGVAVRVGDPLARMIVRTGFDAETNDSIGSFAVPIGLAVEDEARRMVNLVPGELRDARKRTSLAALAVPVAVILPIVALGVLTMQARGDVADRETQLLERQSEYSALPVPTTPEIDPALSGVEAIRAGAVAEVLGSRVAWEGVLRDFAKVLPENVWLTQLSAKVARPLSVPIDPAQAAATTTPPAGALPTAAAASGVTITGYTYSQADVAKLLARLATLPTVSNVQLQTSAGALVGEKSVVQFTILADLRESGGAA